MALGIYAEADPGSAFSSEGTFDNPITTAFDGTSGGVVERRYYVRNDAPTLQYSDIAVSPVDGGDNLVDGSAGYSWKLIVGDQRPLEEQWSLKTAGEEIDLSDITDTTTYLPFWVRIEVPRGAPVESFQSVSLQIEATESII
jgi:hypothetical protein